MFWIEFVGIRFDCLFIEDVMKFGIFEICFCGIIMNWFLLIIDLSCIVEVWVVLLEIILFLVLEVFIKFKGELLVFVIWEFIGMGWYNVVVGINMYVGVFGL